MMLASDNIKTRTEGMLKGMQIVDVSYSDDGGCEVTVEVNINEKGQFFLSALNAGEIKLTDDYPKFDWVALRNEWAAAKNELAHTQKTLEKTNEKLYSTQYELSNKEEELTQIKSQFAALKQDFNKTKEQLLTSNMDICRMEEKLKYANLEKDELKAAFDYTSKELNNTSGIVKRLKNILDDRIFQLAVDDKGLAKNREYLIQEENDLDKLHQELKTYGEKDLLQQPGNEKLLEFVQRTRDIQQQTVRGFQDFPRIPSSSESQLIPDHEYSGLLIDARGFPLKQVLAPSILTEKKEKLYGLGVIPATLGNDEIVAYLSGDIEKAKKYSKIGGNPLVIKPVQVANECDVMINDTDVKKLASIYQLLEQQKVAIMI
jgi:predicted  nucleic acid-binding Zn-ribbon protein